MEKPETAIASELASAVCSCEDRAVPSLRRVRRAASKRLEPYAGRDVLHIAQTLLDRHTEVPGWLVYELVHHHPAASACLDLGTLNQLGEGMSSWGEVDPFACYLSGVAWREGRISDADVYGWSQSPDRWWRRAALVSTVPLNSRARGGSGDPERTLAVCDVLRLDRDDMVVKACSWALRELIARDPASVRDYVAHRERDLAARVVREVRNKLETGLKNPRRRSD